MNEIFQFYRRREIWVILFYKWNDEESKKMKDEYKSLAEKMYGVLKVGAVDCVEDDELCHTDAHGGHHDTATLPTVQPICTVSGKNISRSRQIIRTYLRA